MHIINSKFSGFPTLPAIHSDSVSNLRQTLSDMKTVPQEEARAMPAEFYTSTDFLELETEDVLRREWMCLGHIRFSQGQSLKSS